MEKNERKEILVEWKKIMKYHPTFARSFLAQQAILIEAAEMGYRLVELRICDLMKKNFPILFEAYWKEKCEDLPRHVEVGGIIGCLTDTNRDPARCFGSEDDEGWFDDPFLGGRELPPKPPDPHIR